MNGSDSNDGSYGSPWKTYLQFVTYYQEGDKPSGHHDPVPGDVFYFFDGTYDDTYLYNGSTEHFFMRNKDGTSSNKIMMKAFPGETSVVFQELYILQTEYWIFEGLTVTAGNNGFRLEEGDFGEIRNCHIYDTNGVENNNDSGIKMTDCENWNIHHNRIHDNYDREDLQQNNANIQTFTGTGNTFTRNVVYNASTGLSACIKAKHGTSGGDWT
ncbi:MAG: right-handed parallel beta-helix repeat-containing protein, partial [Candidatus Riesia sp.]|nr:right-handed parallel beta-helix repeat-containing protein [Candidatus Riesia sp.]